MSAVVQAADRLMNALEELLAREGAEVRTGSGTRVRAVQARMTPVVTRLSRILADPAVARQAAPRLGRIVAARRRNTALMREALEAIRRKIDQNSDALMRLRSGAANRRVARPASQPSGRRLDARF